MYIERSRRRSRAINLTPLIDVVFLLIVFFMLTTSFIEINSIELSLPQIEGKPTKAKAAEAQPVHDKLIIIDVAASGAIYVGDKLQDSLHVETYLKRMISGDKKRPVLIRVVDKVSMQKLVTVMDIVHVAGSRDVSIDRWDGYVPEEEVQVPEIEMLGIDESNTATHELAIEQIDDLIGKLENPDVPSSEATAPVNSEVLP